MALLASTLGSVAMFTTFEAWAGDGQFSLSNEISFGLGKFATPKSTNMLSTPSVSQYETGPWVFKLVVPNPSTSGTGSAISGIGYIRAGNSTQSGLGDTVAAATYSVYAGSTSPFGVDLTGKIKLGLADKFYSLNSGQNDYAAQADAHQNFDRFKALGSLGYKIQGAPAGISMNRVFYGSVGGAYQVNDQMSGGVDFSLSQNPTSEEQGQRQLSAYISHSINKSFRAKGYVLKDFSNGSADHSVGAVVSYGF